MPVIDINDVYQMTNPGAHIDGTELSAANSNLLVNPYFVNSIVINQRGFSATTSVGYTVDMWYKSNIYGTLSLVGNGLQVTGDSSNPSALSQYIPDAAFRRLLGKALTASVQYQSGTVESVTFTMPNSFPTETTSFGSGNLTNCILDVIWRPSGVVEFRIRTYANTTITYRAAKLEIGFVSTLSNDVRINRAEEWAKCRYYFQRITRSSSGTTLSRIGICQNATTATFPNVTNGFPMNGTPSISYTGSLNVWYGDGSTASVTALSLLANAVGDYHIIATSSGMTRGNACMLQITSGAYIDINAQPAIS